MSFYKALPFYFLIFTKKQGYVILKQIYVLIYQKYFIIIFYGENYGFI